MTIKHFPIEKHFRAVVSEDDVPEMVALLGLDQDEGPEEPDEESSIFIINPSIEELGETNGGPTLYYIKAMLGFLTSEDVDDFSAKLPEKATWQLPDSSHHVESQNLTAIGSPRKLTTFMTELFASNSCIGEDFDASDFLKGGVFIQEFSVVQLGTGDLELKALLIPSTLTALGKLTSRFPEQLKVSTTRASCPD